MVRVLNKGEDRMATKHIEASTELCKELQGGYDSYYEGLLLADTHWIDHDGSWIVEHEGRKANVHPITNGSRLIKQTKHNGQNVYGIRYWLR